MSTITLSDTIFFTDDSDPPAVRAFNLGTKMVTPVLYYTMETEQVRESISPLNPDGFNRTLRPRKIAFLQEASDRTALYWADSGAGAIFGVRLDGTPMGVAVSGLHAPEELAIDTSRGFRLYWADIGTNRIETCNLEGSPDVLYTCQEVSTVMSSAPTVTGLALDARLQVLYWLDSTTRRLVAGTLSVPPPRNPPIGPVVEAVSTMVEPIELPVGLAMEEGFSAGFEGALFWLDQRTPASLTKLWLNGSGAVPLVTGGLSSPRAAHYQLGAVYVADRGAGSVVVVEAVSGGYAVPLFQDDALRPMGVTMRDDVDGRQGLVFDSITSGAQPTTLGAHLWLIALAAIAVGWRRR